MADNSEVDRDSGRFDEQEPDDGLVHVKRILFLSLQPSFTNFDHVFFFEALYPG